MADANDNHIIDRLAAATLGTTNVAEAPPFIGVNIFRDIVAPETVAAYKAAGQERALDPIEPPRIRIGIDPAVEGPCVWVEPCMEDIASIDDLTRRAELLYKYARRPLTDLARELILSVSDVLLTGVLLQVLLEPEPPAIPEDHRLPFHLLGKRKKPKKLPRAYPIWDWTEPYANAPRSVSEKRRDDPTAGAAVTPPANNGHHFGGDHVDPAICLEKGLDDAFA